MKAIYGLYPDPDSAQRAVDALRGGPLSFEGRGGTALRIKDRDVVVISSEPFEEHEFGRRDHHTVMPWIAALGGLIGGISGYALAAFTQLDYPLDTSGMPIVSKWPNGIITYEVTMLGVVLATLITWLVAARLPGRSRKKLYDAAVSDGKILVGVLNPPQSVLSELEGRLREAGAEQVVSKP